MTMAPTSSETLNGCVQNAACSNDSTTLPVEEDSHRHRGNKKPRVIQSPAALPLLGILVFFASCTNFILPYVHVNNNIEVSNSNSNTYTFTETSSPSARQCTSDELLVIKRQLPPDDCLMHGHEPWKHKCSLSYATRCGY